MKIGACWAKAQVAEVFEPGDHATTFGGQPLVAAAARTVLEVAPYLLSPTGLDELTRRDV